MPAAMIRALTELGLAGALTGLVVSTGTRVRYHSRAGREHNVPRRIMAFACAKTGEGNGLVASLAAGAAARRRDDRIAGLPLASQDPIQMAKERSKQLFGTDGIRGIPGEYPLDDATLERVGFALGQYVRALSPSVNANP